MPERLDRQSHRLPGRDYTRPGSYFITLCVQGRRNLFGTVRQDQMLPTALGILVERELLLVPRRRAPWVELGEYVVMPNHLHAVLRHRMADSGRRKDVAPDTSRAAPGLEAYSLGAIVATFKAGVTREARRLGFATQEPIWQRDYYDHVIRNQDAAKRIHEYIRNNPLRWAMDRENPEASGTDDFETWLESEGRQPL